MMSASTNTTTTTTTTTTPPHSNNNSLSPMDNRTMTPVGLRDPFYCKVKVRRAHQPHEYVVPSDFAAIPQNPVQRRIIRSAHHSHQRKRFFFPPAIKEESNEDDEGAVNDMDTDSLSDSEYNGPKTPTEEEEEENDENMPLALLAVKKGYVVPHKAATAFPLIQHIPSHHQQQQQANLFDNRSNNRRPYYAAYPFPPHMNSPVYVYPHYPPPLQSSGLYSNYSPMTPMKTPPPPPSWILDKHAPYIKESTLIPPPLRPPFLHRILPLRGPFPHQKRKSLIDQDNLYFQRVGLFYSFSPYFFPSV
ncbi:hypothetical protein BDF20DRAFT_265700 [Mycotypha africana]|uniref:uncharacterized protein n=1 Tax=Mycotypha africana TaxID=64632 RepID=UPI002300F41C|nr:uncharacterized protein BDF20DRAFT_265700 [Mycotypha africana]KAI8987447.1 hypothetical protein BDF20DRAFT_265700 [Mycotypha africana]